VATRTHTEHASLLCSVGKIFHFVHYLSAGLRNTAGEDIIVLVAQCS
jgi:hypothetical protein